MKEIKNAKIESTMLGFEDHDIFSFMIFLDYDGSGQGYGGYVLDAPLKREGKFIKRVGTAFGSEAIMQVMRTIGVTSWEKLPGTVCRVEADFGKVYRIGHFLKDQWLDLEKLAAEYKEIA